MLKEIEEIIVPKKQFEEIASDTDDKPETMELALLLFINMALWIILEPIKIGNNDLITRVIFAVGFAISMIIYYFIGSIILAESVKKAKQIQNISTIKTYRLLLRASRTALILSSIPILNIISMILFYWNLAKGLEIIYNIPRFTAVKMSYFALACAGIIVTMIEITMCIIALSLSSKI
jgi:hypothetical protein